MLWPRGITHLDFLFALRSHPLPCSIIVLIHCTLERDKICNVCIWSQKCNSIPPYPPLVTLTGITLNKYIASCSVATSRRTIMNSNAQRKSTQDLLISRPYRRQLSDNWSTRYIVSVRYWLTHYDLYGVSFWGLDLQIWVGRPFSFISC